MSAYARLAAACCVLASVVAALAVPVPRVAPVDPVGVYVGRCADRDVYTVTVKRDKAEIVTIWAVIGTGHVHYVGVLTLQAGGEWQEKYWPHDKLRSCGPWTWQVVGQKPLAFKSTGGDGWTLTMDE